MVDNTARERRMQRLKEDQRKEMPMKVAKGGGLAVLAILLVGGLGAAIYFSSGGGGNDDCPGHWHATVAVFIEDDNGNPERVRFPQPPYDLGGPGSQGHHAMAMHMHAPNDEQLHFEPVGRRDCMGVKEAMGLLGTDLSADRMVLSGGHEQTGKAGTYAEEGNKTLRFFVHHPDDAEMREESFADLRNYQLRDGEKFLVAYGEHSDDELKAMMQQIRWPSGAVPQHPDA